MAGSTACHASSAATGGPPADQAEALAAGHADKAFAAISLVARKRCIKVVTAAKRAGTPAVRIAKIGDGARAGTDPLARRPKG